MSRCATSASSSHQWRCRVSRSSTLLPDTAHERAGKDRHRPTCSRPRTTWKVSAEALQELPGHDDALDLVGAFVDLGDLGTEDEGRSATQPDLPYDLRFCTRQLPTLIGVCQCPTEQRRSRLDGRSA